MPPAEVAIGLGANLGDRAATLRWALQALGPAVRVTAVSALYESEPWGVADQPRFLNAVCLGETDLLPSPLLEYLQGLEREAGRTAGERWGPRPLDLDILLYDNLVLHNGRLTIPHPAMAARAFVLRPLADVAPDRAPPGWPESVTVALARVGEAGLRRVAGPEWAWGRAR